MTKTTLTLAVFATALAPAFASAKDSVALDANGDGMLTVSEVQAVYPTITAERFAAVDGNSDGVLDEAEIKAAEEAGLFTE